MKKLSICIICKNEETNIDRCLESVTWADEIVIVDSGSSDKTLDIAKKFTDKIYVESDWLGFGIQRQRAENYASNDWVFALDCDEVVSEKLKNEILKQLEQATDKHVLSVNRLTHFCGKFIYHSGWYPDRIVRIYNKKTYQYNNSLVHESVSCSGANKVLLKGDLLHYQYADLSQYINKRNGYAYLGAKAKHEKGKKGGLTQATFSALFAFFRHYILRLGFLDGKLGFVISVIQMQYTFNKYLFAYYQDYRKDK